MSDKPTGYTEWDLQGNRRGRIGADCLRLYQARGDQQYRKAAARINELEKRLAAVGKLRTYGGVLTTHIQQGVVQQNDEWIKATDLKAALEQDNDHND